MKLAILSDIHDNIWKLETLLANLEADALIFCGDFCAPFTLAQIAEGFSGPVHVVFGNNDGDQFLLARVAGNFAHVTLHGDFAELEMDGRQVVITRHLCSGAGFLLVVLPVFRTGTLSSGKSVIRKRAGLGRGDKFISPRL